MSETEKQLKQEDVLDSKGQIRRRILAGTGAVAAGAAIAHFGGMLNLAEAKSGEAKSWPWPYEKLDPAKTAEIAYNEWYRVFCGAAVINSVFQQLAEKVGEPYKSFPNDAFVFLEGGQVGWGTICGSPAGANIVANLIIGPRIAGSPAAHHISGDIMDWYSSTPLPTFKPVKARLDKEVPVTTSESPLCHISVGKWMKATDNALGSPERKDRCARVAASTAYRLVEFLNEWKAGEYDSKSDFSCAKENGITGQFNCMECHGDNVPEAPKMKKS
ncbi:MAG: C-GCAxxG-C-C family protein [Proteobacteria bacterium]|nr:C-GCAxxG-C-C family protein [Pseudomonadota bacterium]MBU1737800.1 C-GCAxxG-C-C family protein [Pseudomonadota bacterium]